MSRSQNKQEPYTAGWAASASVFHIFSYLFVLFFFIGTMPNVGQVLGFQDPSNPRSHLPSSVTWPGLSPRCGSTRTQGWLPTTHSCSSPRVQNNDMCSHDLQKVSSLAFLILLTALGFSAIEGDYCCPSTDTHKGLGHSMFVILISWLFRIQQFWHKVGWSSEGHVEMPALKLDENKIKLFFTPAVFLQLGFLSLKGKPRLLLN